MYSVERSSRRPIIFLNQPIMRSPSLLSEILWRTWDYLSNIAFPQWKMGIVTRCCNCQRPSSLDWWMASLTLLHSETKTMKPISTLLPVFYPISLSTFFPVTSPSICSATGSVLTTPSASRTLRILGASTRPCVTCTTSKLM